MWRSISPTSLRSYTNHIKASIDINSKKSNSSAAAPLRYFTSNRSPPQRPTSTTPAPSAVRTPSSPAPVVNDVSHRPVQQSPPSSSLPLTHYTPPSDRDLADLRFRLKHPYHLTRESIVAASSGASSAIGSRLICLDVGDRYVGIAFSDLDNQVARPLTTIYRKEDVKVTNSKQPISPHSHHATSQRRHTDLRTNHVGSNHRVAVRPVNVVLEEFRQLFFQYQCVGVVVGMPLNLQFKIESQCTKTIQFVDQLKEYLNKHQRSPIKLPSKSKSSPSASSPSVLSSSIPFVVPSFYWWDERLSSSDARHQLSSQGLKGRQLAKQLDAHAAANILQEFIHRMNIK